MNPLLIGGLFDVVGKLADRLWPDPAKKAEAQLELLKMSQAGEFKQLDADLQLALAQSEVNKVEAAAPDFFTRGWRPFIGWVCGLGLAYQFLLRPLLMGLLLRDFPELGMETLMTLLFGLLGLGSLRTTEKIKGVAR
ncbi:holin family protein [Propionivibrio sp.]|uniref:holin family protein n=1 Tax=Propionivibrio sp. TaxID=2212460 RepID=UPI003BF3BDD4